MGKQAKAAVTHKLAIPRVMGIPKTAGAADIPTVQNTANAAPAFGARRLPGAPPCRLVALGLAACLAISAFTCGCAPAASDAPAATRQDSRYACRFAFLSPGDRPLYRSHATACYALSSWPKDLAGASALPGASLATRRALDEVKAAENAKSSAGSSGETAQNDTAKPQDAANTDDSLKPAGPNVEPNAEDDAAPSDTENAPEAAEAGETEAEAEAFEYPPVLYDTGMLNINGVLVEYVEDLYAATPATGAALWAGSDATFDNAPGYFIGHNPGDFAPVMSLELDDPITVHDRFGETCSYHVIDEFIVPNDTWLYEIADRITGHGEAIILQTCVGDDANFRIVLAVADEEAQE